MTHHRTGARAVALLGLLVGLGGPAWSTSDTALQLSGTGPYYLLSLPLAWQARSRHEDLHDVRIVNAQGQALPYAWVDASMETPVEQQYTVPLFKWTGPGQRAASRPGLSDADASPTSPTSPSWPIWIMDLRRTPGRLERLDLALPQDAIGLFAVAIESSPDLQQWTTLVAAAQLANLSHGSQALRQHSVALDGTGPAYVRIRLLPGSPEPRITQATITAVQATAETPTLSWSTPLRASRCTPRACDYAIPAHVAIARVKVRLDEPNTLMRLQLLGQPTSSTYADASSRQPQEDWHRHHRLRERLHALRHQRHGDRPAEVAGDQDTEWRWIGEGDVHWIELGDRTLRSQELLVDHGRYRMLRLETAQDEPGWAAHPPVIEVASWQRSLVFLARGAAPYRLQWADGNAPPAALPMRELMVGLTTGTQPSPGRARVPDIGSSSQTPAPSPPAAASATAATQHIASAWWLWAALLIGLGLMAYMVRQVLSGPKAGNGGKPRDDG